MEFQDRGQRRYMVQYSPPASPLAPRRGYRPNTYAQTRFFEPRPNHLVYDPEDRFLSYVDDEPEWALPPVEDPYTLADFGIGVLQTYGDLRPEGIPPSHRINEWGELDLTMDERPRQSVSVDQAFVQRPVRWVAPQPRVVQPEPPPAELPKVVITQSPRPRRRFAQFERPRSPVLSPVAPVLTIPPPQIPAPRAPPPRAPPSPPAQPTHMVMWSTSPPPATPPNRNRFGQQYYMYK